MTAVIHRDDEVLLVRHSGNGAWAPVTGIVDPGEEPAVCAVCEAESLSRLPLRTWTM